MNRMMTSLMMVAATAHVALAAGFAPWDDPAERAFSLEVPEGWRTTGGSTRPSALLVQWSVESVSPDGAITTRIGDSHPIYMEPHHILEMAGIREGGFYTDTTGYRCPVRRYAPGADYAQRYLLPAGARVIESFESPEVVDDLNAQARQAGLPARYDAGEIRYRVNRGGREIEGGILCITEAIDATCRMWHPWLVASFEAPADRAAEAAQVVGHMARTHRVDPDWLARQQAMTRDQVEFITRTQERYHESLDRTTRGLLRNEE